MSKQDKSKKRAILEEISDTVIYKLGVYREQEGYKSVKDLYDNFIVESGYNVSLSTFRRWYNGSQIVGASAIAELCKYLGLRVKEVEQVATRTVEKKIS
ncbi:hypothetical protein [Limosilactobacillus antri]|uniref:hypothetical protein n=1 Tax=Limosilactobacillus antri TaxID=227943 RepID=UPI001F57C6A6|nr:hypothetical protein [Limosilactobacillus antri]